MALRIPDALIINSSEFVLESSVLKTVQSELASSFTNRLTVMLVRPDKLNGKSRYASEPRYSPRALDEPLCVAVLLFALSAVDDPDVSVHAYSAMGIPTLIRCVMVTACDFVYDPELTVTV